MGFDGVTKKFVQSVERFYFEYSFTRRAQRDGSMLPLLEAFSENSFRDSLARRRHILLNVSYVSNPLYFKAELIL